MKRFLLAALAALSVTAQAQDFEHVTDIHRYNNGDDLTYSVSTIPGLFTQNYDLQQFYRLGYSNGSYKSVDVYDKNMKVKKTFTFPSSLLRFYYYDYTGNKSESMSITQTLFDEDESYEYMAPIKDPDSKEQTGVLIMKDDGTVIARIDYGDGCTSYSDEVDFIIYELVDEKETIHYLTIKLRDKDGNRFTRFYSFEKGKISSAVKQVKDVRHGIKATPALPKANELVKVDLGGMKSPRTLSVVNANGVVVTRMPLEDGQQEANVSTHGLPAGMYIIRVSDGKTETDNCKIIVR